MVGASVSPSVLEDFGRYLTDVARVPTLKSAKKYVGAVRSYAEAALGIRLPEATLFKSLATRDGQAPKPATKVVKQPCPKHLVAAVIQDSSVDMAVRLAAVLMWFATLRMGELTNQLVAQFDPSFALLRRDVMVAPNGSMACLRLRKGKPDKTNSGSERFITAAPPGAAFCPVRFLQAYLDATPHHSLDEPLLVFSGGPRGQRAGRRCVTRKHVDTVIQRHASRLGYKRGSLTLHCIRSGSTTALVDSGTVSQMDIQIQGGWTSAQGPAPYMRHNVGTYTRASDALAIFADDWRAGRSRQGTALAGARFGFGHKLVAASRGPSSSVVAGGVPHGRLLSVLPRRSGFRRAV